MHLDVYNLLSLGVELHPLRVVLDDDDFPMRLISIGHQSEDNIIVVCIRRAVGVARRLVAELVAKALIG